MTGPFCVTGYDIADGWAREVLDLADTTGARGPAYLGAERLKR